MLLMHKYVSENIFQEQVLWYIIWLLERIFWHVWLKVEVLKFSIQWAQIV